MKKTQFWCAVVFVVGVVVGCDASQGNAPRVSVAQPAAAVRRGVTEEAVLVPKRPTTSEASELSTVTERRVTDVWGLPEVIADYVRYAGTDERTVQERWSFSRQGSHVELRRPEAQLIETWQRDPKSGRLSHTKIFQDERLAVQYTPGDLKGLGVDPNWYLLTHQFDAPPLDVGLKEDGEVVVPQLGRTAVRYSGVRGKTKLQVQWLPKLQIPALIQARDEHGNAHSIELTALRRFGEAPDTFTRVRDYEQIDFADLGDHETDPKIVRLMHRLEAVHAFGAHEHAH